MQRPPSARAHSEKRRRAAEEQLAVALRLSDSRKVPVPLYQPLPDVHPPSGAALEDHKVDGKRSLLDNLQNTVEKLQTAPVGKTQRTLVLPGTTLHPPQPVDGDDWLGFAPGQSRFAATHAGVPMEEQVYDKMLGRSKLDEDVQRGEFHNLPATYANVIKDGPMLPQQQRDRKPSERTPMHITCICGCRGERKPDAEGKKRPDAPNAATLLAPLSHAAMHYVVDNVQKVTGKTIGCLEDAEELMRSPLAGAVKEATRAVLDYLLTGEYQRGRNEDEIAAGQRAAKTPRPSVADHCGGDRPLRHVGAAYPKEAMLALAVKGRPCVDRAFPLALGNSLVTKARLPQLDAPMQIASVGNMLVLIRTILGSEYDRQLRTITHFVFENSKTVVDYRNLIFVIYERALPTCGFYPHHALDAHRDEAHKIIGMIPARFADAMVEIACDSYINPQMDRRGFCSGDDNKRRVLLPVRDFERLLESFYVVDAKALEHMRNKFCISTGPEVKAADGEPMHTCYLSWEHRVHAFESQKPTAGTIAFMLVHAQLRWHVLGARAARDADGYPLHQRAPGVDPRFYDADEVGRVLAELLPSQSKQTKQDSKKDEPGRGHAVYADMGTSTSHHVIYSEAQWGHQSLMRGRECTTFSFDEDSKKSSKTDRSKDMGRKLILGAYLLRSDNDLEELLELHSRGEGQWMTKTAVKGMSIRPDLSHDKKRWWARWALALRDGYTVFHRPEAAVHFDAAAPHPAVPTLAEWGTSDTAHAKALRTEDLLSTFPDPPQAQAQPQTYMKLNRSPAKRNPSKEQAGLVALKRQYAALHKLLPPTHHQEWFQAHRVWLESHETVEVSDLPHLCNMLRAVANAVPHDRVVNAASRVFETVESLLPKEAAQAGGVGVDADTGQAVLRKIAGVLVPSPDPSKAATEKFGIALGLNSYDPEVSASFLKNWTAFQREEKELVDSLCDQHSKQVSRIWNDHRPRTPSSEYMKQWLADCGESQEKLAAFVTAQKVEETHAVATQVCLARYRRAGGTTMRLSAAPSAVQQDWFKGAGEERSAITTALRLAAGGCSYRNVKAMELQIHKELASDPMSLLGGSDDEL